MGNQATLHPPPPLQCWQVNILLMNHRSVSPFPFVKAKGTPEQFEWDILLLETQKAKYANRKNRLTQSSVPNPFLGAIFLIETNPQAAICPSREKKINDS